MLKKSSRLFMLAWLHLTVVLLLAVVGVGMADSGTSFVQQLAQKRTLAEPEQQLHEGQYGQATHQQPCLPEELPVSGSESEEAPVEKEGMEDDALFLSFLAHRFVLLEAARPQATIQNFSSVQAVVPLYVLFHCWKNFLS